MFGNAPAKLLHPYHALARLVAFDVSIKGKLISELQPSHAPLRGFTEPKLVTDAVLIAGKLVRLLHLAQAPANVIAELKSRRGKLVRLLQPNQAPLPTPPPPKVVPDEVSIVGKDTKLLLFHHAR